MNEKISTGSGEIVTLFYGEIFFYTGDVIGA